MIKFNKYNSIENTYNKDFMERIKSEGYDSLEYVVQEKVHGANCSFITDGNEVQFASRTGLIKDGEKFHNYKELLSRYNERVNMLYSMIKQSYPDTESVSIYGEMFGGEYPHPHIKSESATARIQKGVFYSPNHEFYGFDIYVRGAEGGKYLTVDESNNLFETIGFFYAKTLFRGTIDDCLSYPNLFQSRIAEWLGLPAIEDNICEGVVIRPVEPVFLKNGSRLLLKNKNDKFSEKKSVRKRQPSQFVEPTYSQELNDLLLVVEEYITENRLDNTVSKIGEVTFPKDMGRVIGLFSKDILEDFLKEHSDTYDSLEKSEQKILNKHINKLAVELTKRVYMKS